jgi:sugar lactone lactonase YvrE
MPRQANILRGWHRLMGIASLALALLGGCTRPAGVIFPPRTPPLVWPTPPEEPRVAYVGALSTSADLQPAVSFREAVDRTFFGKHPTYSMLTPYAVCTDGGDRLFVADSGAQTVHVFNLQSRKYGRLTPVPPLRFSQPAGVAWSPEGRLYVADSVGGCIYVFDNAGRQVGRLGEGEVGRPAGLAWDQRQNRLLIADVARHCVVVMQADGSISQRIGRRGSQPGEFNYPTNVAIDSQGRMYVSDSLNFRVQQFDANLKPVRSIGRKGDMPGDLSQPKGIAVDGEDHLYVVDAHFEAIQVFDAQGQLLLNFGEEGRGAGQFWLPAGLFIDASNRLWVADTYNRRLQVFEYLGSKQP